MRFTVALVDMRWETTITQKKGEKSANWNNKKTYRATELELKVNDSGSCQLVSVSQGKLRLRRHGDD